MCLALENGTIHGTTPMLATSTLPLTGPSISRSTAMPQDTSIPFGLCQCGCGQPTTIATRNRRLKRHVSGQPVPYINGHNANTLPPHVFDIRGDMVAFSIVTSHGEIVEVLIDLEDMERVKTKRWNAIQTRFGWQIRSGGGGAIDLHRFIWNDPDEPLIDHISLDRLDNRKQNLRPASHAQNAANAKLRKTNKTGYKGVSTKKGSTRYVAQIKPQGKPIHLGYFSTAEEAAVAYDDAARLHYGTFARLNFPHIGERGCR